ncbi:hypothetical protein [Pontibacter russatus]|uniref:hypothetical protein n=1 Tax=Pontibacter russatus TaxID=2694929 RepID=UPI0013797FB9|nr:hypothetical protein [Pontibacter russatus]
MADDLKNSKVIRKDDPDFPAYLHFDKLRSEGIEHLGNLAGHIWTDHNVHDPGITILEVLCYALLDLGYRTNLPETDLLTRNPEDKAKDSNFFTPAQILACNPLTILDYRKLLIDLEGVRNAWLVPATDLEDFCRPPRHTPNEDFIPDERCACGEFLNGLYHVYLDLENTPAGEKAQAFEEATLARVKKALMAHRNLCEDFVDIYVLCKLPMGVCADIELEEKAEAVSVYIAVAEALRNYFTPSPRFYTLQQLLDKQKPIEEIFAGRPYNLLQSHGFVDTEELGQIQLKREIHLSDVYDIILSVPGVKSVRNLALRLCEDGSKLSCWKFKIRENHIPEFSAACSGFRFTRNGMPLSFDSRKHEGVLQLTFSHSGKVLYQSPSPYLDGEIPKGLYRNDLAHYYSIQNDFPRVYGIEEGGLSDDAPNLRKAQALQLKGYLLFFDQLLANYLTQLSSIRSLFALSSPEAEGEQHTYFMNQLSTVPELQKLLRFQAGTTGSAGTLGTEGSTLAFPVDKQALLKLREKGELNCLDIANIGYCEKPDETGSSLAIYTYSSLSEQATAVHQLQMDIYNEAVTCAYIAKNENCFFYYMTSSSSDIALLSRKHFKTLAEAKLQAISLKYIGTFDENYRSFPDGSGNFSFDIELNLDSFPKYLQLLTEDRDLYLQRRQDFLHHLLARFAEQFSDYALLSFGAFSSQQSINESKIKATENFLTHYDDLSSNRGKAYDYFRDEWNNDNISGFEKKVKALSGIENWKRHSLCNFDVYQYEEQYEVILRIAGQEFFTLEEKFETPAAAQEAAQALFLRLSNKENYQVKQLPYGRAYGISLVQDDRTIATFRESYPSGEKAQDVLKRLQQLFSAGPATVQDVYISHYIYYLQLLDYKGNVVRNSAANYNSLEKARQAAEQLREQINDLARWQNENVPAKAIGTLYRDPHKTVPAQFIDVDAFKLDINNTIVGKPDKFTYDLLDAGNRFKFNPVPEFDTEEQAKAHALHLLAWMSSAGHYQIRYEVITQQFRLYLTVEEQDQGVCASGFGSEDQARHLQNEILYIIYEHLYILALQELPSKWKYRYETGLSDATRHVFESIKGYNTPEEAADAAVAFRLAAPGLALNEYKDELRLEAGAKSREFSSVKLALAGKAGASTVKSDIEAWQQVQAAVQRLQAHTAPEAFESSVTTDRRSKEGLYVYRVIDKDNVLAFYSESFGNKAFAADHRKELAKIKCDDYHYLDICLGGDMIRERRDEKNCLWYHYQIRSRNRFSQAGEELILFESTAGYRSRADAGKAFTENYLLILHQASDPVNYGKYISMEEKRLYSSDACSRTESVVFIPQETLRLEELGGYDEAVVRAMVAFANSYPIRLVDKQSDNFQTLFPCEGKQPRKNCRENEKNYVYYFRLNGVASETKETAPSYWQSTRYYATPEEARRQFHFFRMLLCYPGNFFVDCDPCADGTEASYRIYLREVLAESTRRFSTEAQAWGKEGVQQLVCVAQSQEAFQLYQRKQDCCFTFYIACPDTPFYHPCQYDTPQKRDEALRRLYQYKENAWKRVQDEESGGYILMDEQGTPFARVINRNQSAACGPFVELLQKVARRQVAYIREENGSTYVQDDDLGIVVQAQEGYTPEQWQEQLEAFACYFPVVKTAGMKDGAAAYCIEIKLPGLNLCAEAADEEMPCGCQEKDERENLPCSVAWRSRCCFATCEEALTALQELEPLLLPYENYRPVLSCTCHAFGVNLHYGFTNSYLKLANRSSSVNFGNSEMVAVNPQCYACPEQACEATERAWRLIHSEGLHVVEHILLRPRCEEDCRCDQYRASCKDKTHCCFPWKEPETDPCAAQPDICLIPGADPYSFIATVVLPAWPVRFRKPESRQLVESVLYREAPAHVLLRILWLAPHDFCCFESKFKSWGRWLSEKETCLEEFATCDLMRFLFSRNFECLEDCHICLPCPEEEQQPMPCFGEETAMPDDPLKFQNQVNELYCWRKQCEEGYEYSPCNETLLYRETDHDAISLSEEVTATPPSATAPVVNFIPPAPREPAEPGEASNPAPQLLKHRYATYRKALNQLPEKLRDHSAVAQAKAFLKMAKPSPHRVSSVLTDIIYGKAGKTIPEKQRLVLTQNVLGYYLDKAYFGKHETDNITAISNTLEEIRNAKTDMMAVYDYWNTADIKSYIPEADQEAIKEMLTG